MGAVSKVKLSNACMRVAINIITSLPALRAQTGIPSFWYSSKNLQQNNGKSDVCFQQHEFIKTAVEKLYW